MLLMQTKEKLHTLKLTGFIDVAQEIENNTSLQTLSVEEVLGLMVDREVLQRQNRKR